MTGNNLDLLLVHPPTRRKVYQGLADEFSAKEPPYLAALLAAFSRGRGYNVAILDADAESLTIEETAARVEERRPALVAIVVHGQQPSASTQLMEGVGAVCRKIKESGGRIRILLTGTHPSALPERTLREEACDFVGQGEGFFTVLGLLEERPLAQVPGLWHRDGGRAVLGQPDRLLEAGDLSALPPAAWDLLPMEKYRAHNWHSLEHLDRRQPYASIYTSFGCPFKCTFCCINAPFTEGGVKSPRIRYRDPEKIVDEIQMLVERYGVRNLKIIDEMFVLDQRHYVTVAKKLLERGLGEKLNIWAYARVDTIREGYLHLLKDAGINWLALGIESGSKHVRDGVEKGRFGQESIIANVKKVKEAGINVIGNYIFGLPDDTIESMQETLALAGELNCEWANFYSAVAYPGSQLHVMAARRTLPVPENWDRDRPILPEEPGGPGWIGYSQHAYETLPLPTEKLFPEEVLRFRDQAHLACFQSSRYLGMVEEKFGKGAAEHILEMNSHKLRRKILGD